MVMMLKEIAKVLLNTMQSNRNDTLVFIRQNQYNCCLNNISNHLRSGTDLIKKDRCLWKRLSFKISVKKHVYSAPIITALSVTIHDLLVML